MLVHVDSFWSVWQLGKYFTLFILVNFRSKLPRNHRSTTNFLTATPLNTKLQTPRTINAHRPSRDLAPSSPNPHHPSREKIKGRKELREPSPP